MTVVTLSRCGSVIFGFNNLLGFKNWDILISNQGQTIENDLRVCVFRLRL